jgi:hypothetical protein
MSTKAEKKPKTKKDTFKAVLQMKEEKNHENHFNASRK